MMLISIFLLFIGSALNIWASIRMIFEIKPTNFGFLHSQETIDKDARDTLRKKRTVGITIGGTTILLIASVLSNLA